MTPFGLGQYASSLLLFLALCHTAQTQTAAPAATLTPVDAAPPRAFVWGNDRYAGQRFPGAQRNAQLAAETLRQLGFTVASGDNLTLAEWQQQLAALSVQPQPRLVFFYFAGSAVTFQGETYLLPAGVRLKRARELKTVALPFSAVLRQLDDARDSTNIILVDAIPATPFAALRRFAAEEPGLPALSAQTLLAFTAEPALNFRKVTPSAFTARVFNQLQAGKPVNEAVNAAINEASVVRLPTSTKRRALRPRGWCISTLAPQFALRAAPPAAVKLSQAAPPTEPPTDLAFWQQALRRNQPAAFEEYLQRFPQGLYAAEANARLRAATVEPPAKPSVTSAPVELPAETPPAAPPPEPVELPALPLPLTNNEAPPAPLAMHATTASTNRRAAITVMQQNAEQDFYRACYVGPHSPTCCVTAEALFKAFPTSSYAPYATKQAHLCALTERWEKFQAALRQHYSQVPTAESVEAIFAAGEAFLQLEPNYPEAVAPMTLAGTAASYGEFYRDRDRVKGYVERALQLFAAPTTPNREHMTQDRWAQFRELIQAYGNQYLGFYYHLSENPREQDLALDYLQKATQIKARAGTGWRDPNTYWFRSVIYLKRFEQARQQFAALPANQQAGSTGWTLQTQINLLADQLIADYARAVAVARAEHRAFQEKTRQQLEKFWKLRHNDNLAGLEETIARYRANPLVD